METQLSREMLEALVETQARIDKLEFMPMLELLLNQIIKILKIERCSIFRVSPDLEEVNLVAGEPKGKHGIGMKFKFDELDQIREVIETKSRSLILNVALDPRTKETKALIDSEGIAAMLLIPLLARGEVIGVIVADATGERKGFSEEEMYFCLTLSNLASLLLERDLMQKEKAEKETLMILGQAAAEAAHRLRNPLQIIGGYARRMQKIEDSQFKDYSERIVDEVSRLERTVNDLLNFSRPKRTKLEKINVSEVIAEVKESILQLVGGKNIRIDLKLDSELPVILGDPYDIKDVFSSILKNAVEAIQSEGKILIKSKCGNGWIRVSITNTGGCINEEILQEIFNPFFSTKTDATGMGLATAMNIVRVYNGEIKVENDKSLNLTTFILKLPTNLTVERG